MDAAEGTRKRKRSSYRQYYDKDFLQEMNQDIPESTLRSQRHNQNLQEEAIAETDDPEDSIAYPDESEDSDTICGGVAAGGTSSADNSSPTRNINSPEPVLHETPAKLCEVTANLSTETDDDKSEGDENGEQNGMAQEEHDIYQTQYNEQVTNMPNFQIEMADDSIASTIPLSPLSSVNLDDCHEVAQDENTPGDNEMEISQVSNVASEECGGDQDSQNAYTDISSSSTDNMLDMETAPAPLAIDSDSSSDGSDINDGMQRANEIEEQLEPRNEPQVEEQHRQSFQRLRNEIDQRLKQTITEPVTATYGEALVNALELSEYHHWNHTETSNVIKLLNSLFDQKILGDTRYLVDELFFSDKGMHYYFFCSKCSAILPDINFKRQKEPVCCVLPECQYLNQVKDLKKESYFVTFNVPSQLEFLFRNDTLRSQLKDPFSLIDSHDTVMRDLYDGSSYRSFVNVLDKNVLCKYLSFTICTDGSPLFKSSGCSIWPCFLMINELPIVTRMKNLLVVGLWFGSKKAKLDLFLKPIVDHLNSLSVPGFSIRFGDTDVFCKGYLICCCVDSGARGEVQGIHSHRGECGCNWCLHPGEECEGRKYSFVYPFHDLRTAAKMLQDWEESVRTKSIVNGCTIPSHLASARYFNIVDGMIYDYMHNFCEGNVKTFLFEWLSSQNYLSKHKDSVSALLKSVKCPLEFRKNVRDLDVLSYWTGRELENFGLFLSICLLIEKLPEEYLKHWSSYVQAMHILLAEEITPGMLDIATELIIDFVGRVEYLYGVSMMRYNVHITLHAVENVKRWGNLFAISAFAFEHGIQKLKHVIFANKGIPNQVCRAVSQERSIKFLKNSLSSQRCDEFSERLQTSRVKCIKVEADVKLLGKSSPFSKVTNEERFLCQQLDIKPENCWLYGKIQIGGWHYCTENVAKKASTDNSKAWLSVTQQVVLIKKLLYDETSNKVWVVYSVVRCTPYQYPQVQNLKLNQFHLLAVNSIDGDLFFHEARHLHGIFVSLDLYYGFYLSPMPNCYNIF